MTLPSPAARLRLAFCLLLTLGLAGWAAVQAQVAPTPTQTLQIDSALVAPGDGSAFPSTAAAQTAVRLPHDWSDAAAPDGPVWYRVGFRAFGRVAPGDLMALYVEHVCSNLEVHLNGQLVHGGGRMQEPLTHNCNHPQLVSLPAALIRSDLNTIDIKVAGHPLRRVGSRHRAGGLSALTLGPQSGLAARHARRTALKVSVPQAVSATLLVTGGFMFVLGFVNRRESHLAYFGALSVGWALVDARLWLRNLPWSQPVAEFLLCSLLGFITLAAVQFLLRSVGTRVKALNVALLLQCGLLPLTLAVAGPERLYTMASFWYALLTLQVLAAAAHALGRPGKETTVPRWAMGAMLAGVALAGGTELASQWSGTRPLAADMAQLITPLLVVLVGLRLVQQQGRALHTAEEGKAQLEVRVRDATAEIERSFRQLAELRVEQVTERERKRIAADLHDDLGAKLLTIVHTSESERISTLAREALEEMRLSVRGLTGRAVRLADALGDWRAEVISRLAQAGIEGDWSAPEDLQQRLSARAYVQTTRILRESVSNIIKHSGATQCTLRCSIAEGDLQLVVQDNGRGIPLELDGRLDRGHGVASMKNRAKQLQGQCLVESAPGYGTVIRLTVPLDRALESA